MINTRFLKIIMAAILFGIAALGYPIAIALGQNKAPKYELNPKLLNLPKEKWIKIHQQSFSDPVWFIRQQHGGSTFDTRRGRLVLFGSDTHGKNWLNTPLFFDLNTLEWHRLYRSDSLPSYRVTLNGLPVAGPKGDHPWAMHTFGAVTYDPNADAIVVASYPAHMIPGRFTGALAKLWSHVKTHPTWILELGKGRWQPLASTPVHFFPYATAFDTRRGVVLGYRNDGVYELSLARGHWQQVAKGGLLEWGNNAVFDSQNNVLVVYGSHKKRNDIVVFEIATGRHRIMPTSGPRPSGDIYVPMAFHAGIGKTAAIIDQRSNNNAPSSRASWAETWLYDYAGDAWTHVKKADLPFNVGMNYNLEFDPRHQLLLLVVEPPDRPLPAIWALSLGNNSQSNLSLRRAEPLAPSPKGEAAYKRGDYAVALKLLRPLAAQGQEKAQYHLGLMYRFGRGVPRDYAEAVKWYRKAAEQGNDRAQNSLGVRYQKGQGVRQDYALAHMWYSLAVESGSQKAAKNRTILARLMTPAQISKAKKMALEWRAKHSRKK